ncbi:uncharacterized protein LOC113285608 isoform X2 [Papaver somniferum]|uniref:uncharacterized protein LOC113285608 isoform X2 n=1 Tax=Papaver somniferum TaxID=3469 RepID=UPI000E703C68|nr:uncharacterized protein LOC113285608 isoform X2 [Papaver somniferum]
MVNSERLVCRIAVYKTLYTFGSYMPDVMAAVDQLIWSKKFVLLLWFQVINSVTSWNSIGVEYCYNGQKPLPAPFLEIAKQSPWVGTKVINSVTSWNSIGVEYCHNGQKPLPAPFLEIAKQSPWVGTKVINSVTSWNSIGVEYCYNGQKPLPAPFLEIAKQSPWVGTKVQTHLVISVQW